MFFLRAVSMIVGLFVGFHVGEFLVMVAWP